MSPDSRCEVSTQMMTLQTSTWIQLETRWNVKKHLIKTVQNNHCGLLGRTICANVSVFSYVFLVYKGPTKFQWSSLHWASATLKAGQELDLCLAFHETPRNSLKYTICSRIYQILSNLNLPRHIYISCLPRINLATCMRKQMASSPPVNHCKSLLHQRSE